MARYGTVKDQMKSLTATAAQQPEEIRERRTAAEGGLAALTTALGQKGTYDLPSTAPSAPPSTPPVTGPTGLLSQDGYKFANLNAKKKYGKLLEKGYSPEEAAGQLGANKAYEEGGLFTKQKTGVGVKGTGGKGGTQTTTLDTEAMLEQQKGSSMFRQVSRMVAESEQMLARSGPLWDEMMRSTQLPIIEGAAAASRENAEAIRKAMAKGGAARRDAFGAVQKIRAQEQVNMQKGQQLAQAHVEMDRWARENAKNVINFATGWAQNQAGIRESYHSAMDAATDLMASKSLPFIFNATTKQQEYRDAQSAQSRGKVMKQISGVLGVATSVVGLVGSFYGQGGGSEAGAKMMEESTKGQTISNNYMQASQPGSKQFPTGPDEG